MTVDNPRRAKSRGDRSLGPIAPLLAEGEISIGIGEHKTKYGCP